jgi:predicted cation transporter
MNHVSALVILLLLLFGPLAISSIEHNIEIYCLGLGVLATFLGTGFTWGLIVEALHEPVAISIAVIVAALLFGWSGAWLERIFGRLRRRVSRPLLSGLAVFVVAITSSVITAIVAALVLVQVIAMLHFERDKSVRVTVAGCFAIGMGAALTPLGEPLSTLAARALHLGFFGLFELLAPWVLPGVIASSIVAGVFARGEYDDAHAVDQVRRSNAENPDAENLADTENLANPKNLAYAEILVQAGKVFAFIAGLVLISDAYAPIANEYVARMSNDLLFWANTVSAALDNATLVALEVHKMTLPRAREAILALLVSGGMLIPGNIPNIVSAGALKIGSADWAKVGVPMGLILLGIYFAVLKALG